MSANPARRLEMQATASGRPLPSNATTTSAMLFRIVGPHQHRAVLGDRVFRCERETTKTDERLTIRWSAFEGQTLLAADCRTLNAAKQVCRLAAGGGQPAAS